MARAEARLALCALAAAAAWLAWPSRATAEPARERGGDGVYGRFDGDLDLGVGAGAEICADGRATPAVRGSAHYFSVAGVYLEGRLRAAEASPRSLLGVGVDLRPLFVPRWGKGFETGPNVLDLTLDSISLSLGAFWSERWARGPSPGRGFEVGLGAGLPLLANAIGPWLESRAVLRYPDGSGREASLFVALAWHGFVLTPLSASR